MIQRDKQATSELYITPDERRLLARVAGGHGVGRDYLALRRLSPPSTPTTGRPLPNWLDHKPDTTPAPLPLTRARAEPQAQHCHSCSHLTAVHEHQYTCAAGVWTHPMQAQSVGTSQRLRRLSRTCPHYLAIQQPAQPAPHHCRACAELAAADTVDERYVCARAVWTNAMRPQSVANARRLARLSAACPYFVAKPSGWLPRTRPAGKRKA